MNLQKITNSSFLKTFPILLIFLCLAACEDDDRENFELDRSVQLESFRLNDVEGNIDQESGNIFFSLPYQTDITALTPEVQLPEGASIEPSPEMPTDFTSEVEYMVNNGNLYKFYTVEVETKLPIISFSINGIEGTINHNNQTISLVVPQEVDITSLQPDIELTEGVSIDPPSGSTIDFSEPVNFTVSINDFSTEYLVTVNQQVTGTKVGYLGLAPTRQDLTDPDEIAASDWLFNNFSDVEYISFEDVSTTDFNEFDVLWWHYDSAIELPNIALSSEVIIALKNFRNNGGNLLLTSFATQYVETLNIVPAGHGPNNVFGDFLPNGFVDEDNSWGISFVGHEEHPIFQDLETFAPGKAYLLESGTFRLNHTSWWFLPEWGGYGNGQNWRNETGGINLASEDWDDNLDGRVGIAEFPGNEAQGNVVVIAFGAYDWYNEDDPNGNPSQPNAYLDNIHILTNNSIQYLAD